MTFTSFSNPYKCHEPTSGTGKKVPEKRASEVLRPRKEWLKIQKSLQHAAIGPPVLSGLSMTVYSYRDGRLCQAVGVSPGSRSRYLKDCIRRKVIIAAEKFRLLNLQLPVSLNNIIQDSPEAQSRYLAPTPNALYDLTVRDGVLYLGNSRTPYSTDPTVSETIIGIDERGTIRVMPNDLDSIDRVFHSTLFSAGSLRFAGVVQVVNGRIVELINDSGHYRPRKSDLIAFAKALNDRGLDLSEVTLGLCDIYGASERKVEARLAVMEPDSPAVQKSKEKIGTLIARPRAQNPRPTWASANGRIVGLIGGVQSVAMPIFNSMSGLFGTVTASISNSISGLFGSLRQVGPPLTEPLRNNQSSGFKVPSLRVV